MRGCVVVDLKKGRDSLDDQTQVAVSVGQLRAIHRDLDACQKVIWLAGVRPRGYGFDPAYCSDAQARLSEIEALIANGGAQTKQAVEPLYITHRPLIRNAIGLLRMRRPVAHDVQQVIDDLEMMLKEMPTPSAPAEAHWLEVAEVAAPSAQTEQPERSGFDDKARLDFILEQHRKVIVELKQIRMGAERLEVYVEEGFLGDIRYPTIAFVGAWDGDSAAALETKRRAIDAALSAQGGE